MVLKENVKKNIIKGNTNLYDKAKMCFQFIILLLSSSHMIIQISHTSFGAADVQICLKSLYMYVRTSDI